MAPVAAATEAGELVPPELRQLAARAARRDSWPRLRRYAGSRTDPEQRGLAWFVLGYREYEADEYAAGAKDLHQAAASEFSLADAATYYWAAAARRAGDPLQAAEAVAGFAARFPSSPLGFEAMELFAEALLEAHEPQRALQALAAEPRVHQRPSLALLRAQAYFQAEKFQDAARAFQEVYFAFPAAPQAKAAGEALDALRSTLGAAFPSPTEEMQTARVETLVKASRFDEALKEDEELLRTQPSSSFVLRWRLQHARCLLRLRRTGRAVEELSPSLAADTAIDAERLALLVEAYAQQGDATAMLQVLSLIQSLYPQSPAYASALSTAGNFSYRQLDWQSAARYYLGLTESLPQSEYARDASWRLAWTYYLAQDRDRMHEALRDHIMRYPDSPHVAAALYWLARIEEERGASSEASMHRGEARALYALLGKRFVHSYYAIQAGERLRNLPPSQVEGEESKEASPVPKSGSAASLAQAIAPPQLPRFAGSPCGSVAQSNVARRALTLRALSLENSAEDYLKAALAESSKEASPNLWFLLSQLERDQGNVSGALLDAIKVAPAYSRVEFAALPEELYNLLFPRSYGKLIERQARANRLDPFLVMGLIRQESAFNPRATSSANARGLMQILPKTASRSRRSSRLRSVGRQLYDPAYNVRVGCAYLRGLLKQFDGKSELALAAYHAGDFRVKDWLTRYAFRDSTEFLETIPIPATRAYVEAVLRDAAIYRKLLTGSPQFAKCN
jgi:soluble lytic murein transglycosylase